MAATNPALLKYDGTMGVNMLGERVPFATTDSWNAQEADRLERERKSMAAHNRLVRVGQIASVAPFAFAGGAALAGGTGAAASVPGAVGASSAPLGTGTVIGGAAKGMTLGNIWNLANLGVGGVTSLLGMRSSNNAANQQIALARQQMTMQQQADAEARAEAKRQFDAQQANETKRIASEDADRAYTRQQSDYQMQLLRDREARLAPYRAQADRARQRLAAFLGLG